MKNSEESTDHGQRAMESDVTMLGQAGDLAALAPGSKACLIVLEGWEIGREIEVHGQSQELGRSNLVSTLVNAPSVSRRHAKIDRVDESGQVCFVLTDLGSSNGTRVNGDRVERARLRNGDKVRLGDVLFKFVILDEIDAQFHQKVHHLIHYDQLTGLLTMDAFRMRLESMLRMRTHDARFTLAMTDLDGLKKVNDTYGHLAGRMIVREMGVMIRQCLRAQDIAALYGGDETVLLFPDTAIEEAATVAEQLRATIAARVFEHNGHSFGVTISQGLAEWPRHGQGVEALIASADAALYAAKARGRNCVVNAEAAVG